MDASVQRWSAWCGPAFMVLFGIGFWAIAGFLPPPSPEQSAADISSFYAEHTVSIRAGLALTMLASTFLFPWVGLISTHLRRAEGHAGPLTYAQLASGGIGFLLFVLPVFVWQTAAYRPDERPADTIKMLNDLGWLPFVGIATPAIMQCVCIAIAALRDTQPEPVFPRWLGYFNVFASVTFLPAAVLPFFKNGPFAWNGLFSLYIPLVVFTAWFIVMFLALLGAIRATDRQMNHKALDDR